MLGTGNINLTADNIVIPTPVLLAGLTITVSVAGGDVTLYNGLDAASGIKVHKFVNGVAGTMQVNFIPPLNLERGLFLDVGSNVTEVSLQIVPFEKYEG